MPADVLPRNYLRPCLLLLLREQPSHGYELLERLRTLGFDRDDPGRLYRTLRALERERLVQSAWADSPGGPDRRIYALTRAGAEELHRTAKQLVATRTKVDVFLSRYAEFVAVERAATPARR